MTVIFYLCAVIAVLSTFTVIHRISFTYKQSQLLKQAQTTLPEPNPALTQQ